MPPDAGCTDAGAGSADTPDDFCHTRHRDIRLHLLSLNE